MPSHDHYLLCHDFPELSEKVAVICVAIVMTPAHILQLLISETIYHGDNALLYVAYVMLILAAPIPADRWHCSLSP